MLGLAARCEKGDLGHKIWEANISLPYKTMTRTTPFNWNALFLSLICGILQPLYVLLFFKASIIQISWLAGAGCPGLLSLTL